MIRHSGAAQVGALVAQASSCVRWRRQPWQSAALTPALLQDAHHTTGRQRANRFTWDSATNRFNGPSCPQYNARYDRILYRGDGLAATQLTLVASEPVRGDKQEPESAAYLSDHFGICATLDLPHGPWKRTHLGLELGGRGADG